MSEEIKDQVEVTELDDQTLDEVAGGITDTNNCGCTNNCKLN